MARDDYRKYENDVYYEAWRSGIDPDRAVECARDCYWDHRTPEECVDGTMREIREAREAREQERAEEQHHWDMIQQQREAEQAQEEAYYAAMAQQQEEQPEPPQ